MSADEEELRDRLNDAAHAVLIPGTSGADVSKALLDGRVKVRQRNLGRALLIGCAAIALLVVPLQLLAGRKGGVVVASPPPTEVVCPANSLGVVSGSPFNGGEGTRDTPEKLAARWYREAGFGTRFPNAAQQSYTVGTGVVVVYRDTLDKAVAILTYASSPSGWTLKDLSYCG